MFKSKEYQNRSKRKFNKGKDTKNIDVSELYTDKKLKVFFEKDDVESIKLWFSGEKIKSEYYKYQQVMIFVLYEKVIKFIVNHKIKAKMPLIMEWIGKVFSVKRPFIDLKPKGLYQKRDWKPIMFKFIGQYPIDMKFKTIKFELISDETMVQYANMLIFIKMMEQRQLDNLKIFLDRINFPYMIYYKDIVLDIAEQFDYNTKELSQLRKWYTQM